MKGILYYFSGTGNTKWAADKFRNAFESYGCEIILANIEKVDEDIELNEDMLILGTPVYAGMPPRIFTDFLNRLPLGGGKKCVIYSTQEKNTSSAASIISQVMKRKGYSVVMQVSIKMPGNFYFKKSGHMVDEKSFDEVLKKSGNNIKELVKSVMLNREIVEKQPAARILISRIANKNFTSRLHSISAKINTSSDCNKCGLCLRNCPKGNITFENGQAVFHSNCMLCLRCIHVCPINVITYDGRVIKQTQKDIIKNLDII